MTERPLVAVVHATPAAMAPTEAGFGSAFPEAVVWNLLDDRLVVEAAAGGLTPSLRSRMLRLIDHAVRGGADGVLMTCSMYGGVRAMAASVSPVPVLAADDALFAGILEAAPTRGVLLANLDVAVADSLERFGEYAAEGGAALELAGHVVPALDGDIAAGVAAARAVLVSRAPAADLVVLGQYSLAPLAEPLAELLEVPVLSGPVLAARRLKALLTSPPGSSRCSV